MLVDKNHRTDPATLITTGVLILSGGGGMFRTVQARERVQARGGCSSRKGEALRKGGRKGREGEKEGQGGGIKEGMLVRVDV